MCRCDSPLCCCSQFGRRCLCFRSLFFNSCIAVLGFTCLLISVLSTLFPLRTRPRYIGLSAGLLWPFRRGGGLWFCFRLTLRLGCVINCPTAIQPFSPAGVPAVCQPVAPPCSPYGFLLTFLLAVLLWVRRLYLSRAGAVLAICCGSEANSLPQALLPQVLSFWYLCGICPLFHVPPQWGCWSLVNMTQTSASPSWQFERIDASGLLATAFELAHRFFVVIAWGLLFLPRCGRSSRGSSTFGIL